MGGSCSLSKKSIFDNSSIIKANNNTLHENQVNIKYNFNF